MTPRLLAIGLVVHTLVYFADAGFAHFRDNTLPVLALRVSKRSRIALHLLYLGSFSALSFAPNDGTIRSSATVGLALLIASFPRRVPNHLVLALLVLLALALGSDGATVVALGSLTVAIAGFHKLNADFFSKQTSCGYGLVLHYLLQRGIRPRHLHLIYLASTFGVVTAELLLPVLIWCGGAQQFAVVGCLALAFAFGVLGHSHFAVVLASSLSPLLVSAPDLSANRLALTIGAVLGLLLANVRAYQYPWIARLCGAVMGAVVCSMISCAMHGVRHVAPADCSAPLLGFCVANGLSPYLGIKWDGSFAMFSNLRPDRWAHYLVRRRLRLFQPRYVTEIRMLGIGDAELRRWFSDPDGNWYVLGYVYAAARALHATQVEGLMEDGMKHSELLWRGAPTKPLKIIERLSVYPVVLPRSEEPLCA